MLPAREDRRALLAIALVWATSAILWLSPGLVKPDGAGYYVYLPSAVFDRDLLFFDEWSSLGLVANGRILFKEVTATDHLGNHWPAGSAVFWLPSFAIGGLFASADAAWSASEGIALPYFAACVAASAIAGLLTLFAGFAAARRTVAPGAAAAAAIAVWFGSPLLWYALRNSLMSHAPGALVASLLVLLAMRLREQEIGRWDLLGLGLACGFAFAIRPQNATLALVPVILLPNDSLKRALRGIGWLAAGAALGALPQLAASQALYGSPFGFMKLGGDAWKPFAPFERIWIVEPMVSWFHGMIPWTPFLAVAVAGWVFLARSDRRLAVAAAYAFASQWAINALLERSFWGGYAFGQRRFDNCTIFFILGAAALFARAPRWLSALLAATTCGWTLLLAFAGFGVLNLNHYQTGGEVLAAAGVVARDLGRYFVPLGGIPPEFHTIVAAVALAVAAMFAALLWLVARLTPARRTALAAAYFIAVAALFAWAGAAGDPARYARLIGDNRSLGILSGAVDFRMGLLREEADFLRKSGRAEEAADTERELAALIEARRREAARLGVPLLE